MAEKFTKEELQAQILSALTGLDKVLTDPLAEECIPEPVQYGALLAQVVSSLGLTIMDEKTLAKFCTEFGADLYRVTPKLDDAFLDALDDVGADEPDCAGWTEGCLERAADIVADLVVDKQAEITPLFSIKTPPRPN